MLGNGAKITELRKSRQQREKGGSSIKFAVLDLCGVWPYAATGPWNKPWSPPWGFWLSAATWSTSSIFRQST